MRPERRILTLAALLLGGACIVSTPRVGRAQQSSPPTPRVRSPQPAQPRTAVRSQTPQEPQTPAIQVTIVSNGSGRDGVAIGYDSAVAEPEARKDLEALARECGSDLKGFKYSNKAGIPVVEAKLAGLTNWKTGQVNLDAINRTFRRAPFFRVMGVFEGPFPLRAAAEWTRGPLRIQTQASDIPGQEKGSVAGRIVDYRVWVDQRQGVPAEIPSVFNPPPRQTSWLPVLFVVATAAGVALLAFLAVYKGRLTRRKENA